jgi:hypothetical protein
VPLSNAIFHAELRVRRESCGFIEALLLSIAIKFVIALIEYWWEHRVDDPGDAPMAGEPDEHLTIPTPLAPDNRGQQTTPSHRRASQSTGETSARLPLRR